MKSGNYDAKALYGNYNQSWWSSSQLRSIYCECLILYYVAGWYPPSKENACIMLIISSNLDFSMCLIFEEQYPFYGYLLHMRELTKNMQGVSVDSKLLSDWEKKVKQQ